MKMTFKNRPAHLLIIDLLDEQIERWGELFSYHVDGYEPEAAWYCHAKREEYVAAKEAFEKIGKKGI